jgi:DNA-binding transcriptional LysR family regulator
VRWLHVAPSPFELPPVEVRLVWHEREQNAPAHAWLRGELVALGAELEGKLGTTWATGESGSRGG